MVWQDFWAATRAVELAGAITAHAVDLAGLYALRGADSVHLPACSPSEPPKRCSRSGTTGCEPEPMLPASGWLH